MFSVFCFVIWFYWGFCLYIADFIDFGYNIIVIFCNFIVLCVTLILWFILLVFCLFVIMIVWLFVFWCCWFAYLYLHWRITLFVFYSWFVCVFSWLLVACLTLFWLFVWVFVILFVKFLVGWFYFIWIGVDVDCFCYCFIGFLLDVYGFIICSYWLGFCCLVFYLFWYLFELSDFV